MKTVIECDWCGERIDEDSSYAQLNITQDNKTAMIRFVHDKCLGEMFSKLNDEEYAAVKIVVEQGKIQ